MTNQLWLAVLQSLITIGAVVLLWSLHTRLVDRPVFKWWAWAWTSFAVYLGVGALGLPLTPGWTFTKIVLVILVAISGSLPPLFLVFGARSVLSAEWPTRRGQRAGLALVLAFSAVTVVLSLWWRNPLESFYVRIAPRTLALAAALFYCAWVFLSRWRVNGSRASLITGGVCLFYGATQSVYGAALAGRIVEAAVLGPVVDPIIAWRPQLFLLDLVNVYGTCVGLVLLFVEDYQQSQQALQESLKGRQEVAGENLALQAEIEVRRRAEDALQRSEEKFAAAFRSNPCAMAITLFDPGTIVDVNDVCVRQSGTRATSSSAATPTSSDSGSIRPSAQASPPSSRRTAASPPAKCAGGRRTGRRSPFSTQPTRSKSMASAACSRSPRTSPHASKPRPRTAPSCGPFLTGSSS